MTVAIVSNWTEKHAVVQSGMKEKVRRVEDTLAYASHTVACFREVMQGYYFTSEIRSPCFCLLFPDILHSTLILLYRGFYQIFSEIS
jgi:hypothetical protein